jgi:hypothetical protein
LKLIAEMRRILPGWLGLRFYFRDRARSGRAWAKASRTLCSVAEYGRLPTYSFLPMVTSSGSALAQENLGTMPADFLEAIGRRDHKYQYGHK